MLEIYVICFHLHQRLTGRNRWVHLGFIIAALFMIYIYLGKESFMKGSGYGLPALISGDVAAGERRIELDRLKLETKKQPGTAETVQKIQKLDAMVSKDSAVAGERGRSIHYLRYAGWFLSTFFILFVLPVVFIAVHPRLRLKDYGLGLGDWLFSLKIFSAFAVVMALAVAAIKVFHIEGFLRYYPMFAVKGITGHQPDFVFWFIILETCFFLYFVGWEFFFRGLLIFPLSRRIGSLAALVGLVPFAIMHGKPVMSIWFHYCCVGPRYSVLRARSFGYVSCTLPSHSSWI